MMILRKLLINFTWIKLNTCLFQRSTGRKEKRMMCTPKDVIARTAKWIKSKAAVTPSFSEKSSRSRDKKVAQKQTNRSVPEFVAGPLEAELEAVPETLQLQVQEVTPKGRRITRSSTKKALIAKSKSTVTVDLEAEEDPPMADNLPES